MFSNSTAISFSKTPRSQFYSLSETPGPGKYGVHAAKESTASSK